jgi:DNA-binding CsgD family transcriptional regulator
MLPLLEREAELSELRHAAAGARSGRGGVVVIEGPAGIGKTALLESAQLAVAGSDVLVLSASGTELEQELAFGVVRQLFERRLPALDTPVRKRLLSGAAALAQRVLAEPGPQPAASESMHAAMHGLYWLAAGLAARQPLLICVDDAHWADAASLRWLAYLGRRLDGVPLLAIIAGRDAEPGVDTSVYDRVREASAAGVLRPRPLGEDAVAELAQRAFGRAPTSAFARACRHATGGNPFLLGQLLASLRAESVVPDDAGASRVGAIVPLAVARSLLARLAPLGPDARAVAEAAAVLSTDARLERVAAIAGVAIAQAAALVDQLAAAGIVDGADPVEFRHPILRAAVHEQIPRQRRGLAHLAAAERLLAEGESRERAAAHLLSAPPGRRPWVVLTLRDAAAIASARGAPEAAVALLRRALDDCSPACSDVLLELAEAELTIQDPAALEHARRAIAEAPTPLGRSRAGLLAARALTPLGRYEEALAALALVERESELLDTATRRAMRCEMLMLTTWHRGVTRMDDALVALGADDLAGDDAAERLLLALRTIERVSAGAGADPVRRGAERVLAKGDPARPEDDHGLLMAARALGLADELGAARDCFTTLVGAARRRGSVVTVATACGMRAEADLRAGNLDPAVIDAREALEIATEHGLLVAVAAALQILVELALERESPAAAAELVDRHARMPFPRGYPENMVLFARARAAAAAGDLGRARDQLEACGRGRIGWGEHNPSACQWRSELALVLAQSGDGDCAERLAAEEVRLAQRFGAARALGIALRAQALVRSGRERTAGLERAAVVLARSPARLEHARVLADLGAEQRRRGKRRPARATLADALERAHRCGARVLAERCRRELVAAGARPRRELLRGPDALTAGERRVAELAATGLTNRSIAQSLFLTTKTVETHLSHSYSKLGIRSRAELQGVLEPQGG